MFVIKRNGDKQLFDPTKIINAVNAAMKASNTNWTPENMTIFLNLKDNMSVEDIQDEVERWLMRNSYFNAAKAFILYREKHKILREENNKLLLSIQEKLEAKNVQNQNANVDEKSFGGRLGEAMSVVTKDYALKYCMSELSRNNHLNNEIYIHDLDHYALGSHNCLSLPLDDLLRNGFNTRQADVRPANSINTAFQLVAVLFQIQSLQQFGGVAATHLDWTMVPYVRKSFSKHFQDGQKYIDGILSKRDPDLSIEDEYYTSNPNVYKYALDLTKREIAQAAEGMYHNLNTLQSRSGKYDCLF